jgi:hypothetical protein
MNKKNININKIKAVSKRLNLDIFNYDKSFQELKNEIVQSDSQHLLRYVPIYIASYLEVLTKIIVEKLIDYGEPYLSRAKNLPLVKLDYEHIKSFHNQEITTGKLFSATISISNLKQLSEHLIYLFSSGTKTSSAQSIKLLFEKLEEQYDIETQEKHIKNQSQVIQAIKRIFSLRHQYVHEQSNYVLTQTEANGFLEYSLSFIHATMAVFKSLYSPDSQLEMNFHAADESTTSAERVESKISHIKENLRSLSSYDDETIKKQLLELEKAMKHWDKFVTHIAQFESYPSHDGSIYPMLISSSKNKFNQRILSILCEYYNDHNLESDGFL